MFKPRVHHHGAATTQILVSVAARRLTRLDQHTLHTDRHHGGGEQPDPAVGVDDDTVTAVECVASGPCDRVDEQLCGLR